MPREEDGRAGLAGLGSRQDRVFAVMQENTEWWSTVPVSKFSVIQENIGPWSVSMFELVDRSKQMGEFFLKMPVALLPKFDFQVRAGFCDEYVFIRTRGRGRGGVEIDNYLLNLTNKQVEKIDVSDPGVVIDLRLNLREVQRG